jgi:chromosome segregation ATPase
MLKKLLIASVAVIVGTVVLSKVTHISPKILFGDCCKAVQNMVPPEVQLKQLKADVENIDKEIDKNLGTLARMATEVDQFGEDLNYNRDRQAHLKADISDLSKALKDRAEFVVFRGRKCDADDLTRKLEMNVTEYNCLKEKVKVQEKIFSEKKRTLSAAKDRITAMKNEQEKLRVLAVRLEHELELVRMKQIQNQVTDFDDSALSRAQQNAKNVESRLREIEKLIEYKKEFGRTDTTVIETIKGKSREEVLHSAKAALQDDTNVKVAIDNEENDK